MQHLDKLKDFYDSLDSINIVNSNLDKKRDELSSIIKDFDKKTQSQRIDKSIEKQNKKLAILLENTMAKLKKSSTIWVENFEDLLQREKFRSDLENYFIIIIFGKVKAGKSSLGNFIARNNTSTQKPIFFKYDEAGKEEEIKELKEIQGNNEFATNNLECTVEIQGFKLSGLAWIDTPGLGSMVVENGDLAKQYIQSADYIIYPTSSNAPLQQDEISQIKELFEQNKAVSICITKSDTKERQKDENGKFKRDEDGKIAKFLVNKSSLNRQGQENYVKEEIAKIDENQKFKIGDIFSISAHTAQKGIDSKDEDLFINSNMPKFYELITDVVKQKASSLKQSTPYSGIVSFIDNELLKDDTNSSLKSLFKAFDDFDLQVKETQEKFRFIKENTKSDIESEIEFIVSQEISNINKDNSKEIFEKIDNELNTIVQKLINKNIKEILHNFNTSLNELESKLVKTDEFSIQDEYREIEVWYEDRSFLNIITFGLLGSSGDYLTETIQVGDNKEEMILKFKKNRIDTYEKFALDSYEDISQSFFKSILNISNTMKNNIKDLEKIILDYKTNLEKE